MIPTTLDLKGRLGRAHEGLALVEQQPRDRPLRLSPERCTRLLPTDIVHLCLLLERLPSLGFPRVELVPPAPSFIGVYLWRVGFFDWFPQFAPPPPRAGLGFQENTTLIELRRFTDLAGILDLRERLPAVLTAAAGAEQVPGGPAALRRLAGTVYELAENAVAHSRRLSGGPVVGYYMVQRMPKARRTFVAVGDAGEGIPATMRARYPELDDDLTALRQALKPGVSSDDGGGNGLDLACRATRAVPGGVMTIESGGVWLRLRHDGTEEAHRYADAHRLTRVSFLFRL